MANSSKEMSSQTGTQPQQSPQPGGMERYRQSQGLSRPSSPFSVMRRLMGDMDRLFSGFGTPWLTNLDEQFERTFWAPQIDVFERGQELVVHADLPGLRQEDVKINVDQGVLTISGQRSEEQERKDERGSVYHRERNFGSFQRSIALPEGTDSDQIRASFENGVLEVTAPLPPQAQKRGREIPIGPKASAGPKH